MDLHNFRWLQYNMALALCYAAVALMAGMQVSRILYYKHKLLGFQVWFLLFCFVTAFIRCVSFIWIFCWGEGALFLILYWTPSWLQFATFSFLLLFYYATMYHHQSTGRATANRQVRLGLVTYTVINAVFAIFLVVAVVLSSNKHGSTTFELGVIHTQQVLQALMWFILIALLAFYGWRVSSLLDQGRISVPFHPRDMSASMINSVTFSLFAVFSTRCLWDVLSVATGGFHSFLAIDAIDNIWWKQLILFSLFFLWEIIPAVFVLLIFWPIPKTHLRDVASTTRSRGGTGSSLPDFSSPSAISAPLETDARYDSDGDAEADERRPLPVNNINIGIINHPQPQLAPLLGPHAAMAVLRPAPLPAGGSWTTFSSTGAYSPYTVPPAGDVDGK